MGAVLIKLIEQASIRFGIALLVIILHLALEGIWTYGACIIIPFNQIVPRNFRHYILYLFLKLSD
ncbi:MAG: hypothetical protein EAX87_13045 [Candidatus Thorarchaeota archaeon]|nr:hypothetical protein [Candidatus Thorarchaeota archaeon]